MSERAIAFECGDEQLIGIVHQPAEGMARPVGVLIVVGGPQYRVGSHRQFVKTSRALAEAGFPVFRFDYRGMGDSTGDPRTFESIDEDLRCATSVFQSEAASVSGVVLYGLCDGASAALMYAASDTRISGLVLSNPWVRTEAGEARTFVKHYYTRRLITADLWRKVFRGEVDWKASIKQILRFAGEGFFAGRDARSPRDFIYRMAQGVRSFRRPTLVLTSDSDLTAREFEDFCAAHPYWRKWLKSSCVRHVKIRDADHTFSVHDSQQRADQALIDWLEKQYVALSQPPHKRPV